MVILNQLMGEKGDKEKRKFVVNNRKQRKKMMDHEILRSKIEMKRENF